jgi:hypothetical protein
MRAVQVLRLAVSGVVFTMSELRVYTVSVPPGSPQLASIMGNSHLLYFIC